MTVARHCPASAEGSVEHVWSLFVRELLAPFEFRARLVSPAQQL
jgi:hypothetical protein